VRRGARWAAALAVAGAAPGAVALGAAPGAGRWPGLDEAVVERVAREHGRAPRPLLDLGDGDLAKLAFLLAGVVGGFAAGYAWRALTEGRPDHREPR
jgi:cobalt/nickel transport protein